MTGTTGREARYKGDSFLTLGTARPWEGFGIFFGEIIYPWNIDMLV